MHVVDIRFKHSICWSILESFNKMA